MCTEPVCEVLCQLEAFKPFTSRVKLAKLWKNHLPQRNSVSEYSTCRTEGNQQRVCCEISYKVSIWPEHARFSSIYAATHFLMSRLGLNQNTGCVDASPQETEVLSHGCYRNTGGFIPKLNSAEGSVYFFFSWGGGTGDGGWTVSSGALRSWFLPSYTRSHTTYNIKTLNMSNLRCDTLLLRLEDAMRAYLATDTAGKDCSSHVKRYLATCTLNHT